MQLLFLRLQNKHSKNNSQRFFHFLKPICKLWFCLLLASVNLASWKREHFLQSKIVKKLQHDIHQIQYKKPQKSLTKNFHVESMIYPIGIYISRMHQNVRGWCAILSNMIYVISKIVVRTHSYRMIGDWFIEKKWFVIVSEHVWNFMALHHCVQFWHNYAFEQIYERHYQLLYIVQPIVSNY